jgi:hypothetical protein
MMSDPREAKLPKWAQESLAGLRRDLVREQARVATLKRDVGETDVFIRDYIGKDLPLPQGSVIAFDMTPPDWRAKQMVQVYVSDRGTLHVQGDYSLSIDPRASNAFDIGIKVTR